MKNMVIFDRFVRGIHDGNHLEDVEIEMSERQNGEIITVKYKGGYIIVDNGYLCWSITVTPLKVTNKINEIHPSNCVELKRSDGQCAFDILKD